MVVGNVSGVVVSAGGVLAGRVLLFTLLLFLVWFILTVIVMLLFAQKSKKRGTIIKVFSFSCVLFLVLLMVLYFNIEGVVSALKLGGVM
jgi:hypothetical protein